MANTKDNLKTEWVCFEFLFAVGRTFDRLFKFLTDSSDTKSLLLRLIFAKYF